MKRTPDTQKCLPAGAEGDVTHVHHFGSGFSPRDRKSRPSSHRLQSVSLMDTFLRTGYDLISTSPSGSILI